jgi:peptidoglycan lytic transglycosylase G
MLNPKSRVETKVTVREGLRATEIFDLLAQKTGIPRKDFDAAARHPEPLGLPPWAHGRVEGLLFPATYTITPKTKAVDLLEMMVRRFEQAASSTGLKNGATVGARRYSPMQVLTVASIVQAEAPPAAMPKVARVLYNRLAHHMRLQLDTTVNYATGKHGVTTTSKDRAISSPYNTYRVNGLPPGPISAPGEDAMKAAVAPTPGPWLYFVAVNPDTGETKFATTKAEHDRNVAEFRQWLKSHNGSS